MMGALDRKPLLKVPKDILSADKFWVSLVWYHDGRFQVFSWSVYYNQTDQILSIHSLQVRK